MSFGNFDGLGTNCTIISKSVEDTVSSISEIPDDKSFVHYNTPTILQLPVLVRLPENADVKEVRKRLGIDRSTHNLLLVWPCPPVQKLYINMDGRETQMIQETP
jgi:hypothetical protein